MTEPLVKNIKFNLIALLVSFFTSVILLFSLIIFPVFQFSLLRVSLEFLMIRLIVFIVFVFLLVFLMNSLNYLLMPLMSIVDSRLLVLINYDFLISIRIAKLPLNFVFDFFILFPTLVLLIKTRRIVFKQNIGYMYNPSLS